VSASDLVPHPHELLASDAERERVVEALRTHAADGRLEADELEQRLEGAYAARTRADLVPLVADLPRPQAPRPRRPSRALPHLAPVIPLAILLVAIWALTGAGYFWPVWPIGALLLTTLKHRGHGRVQAPSRRRAGAA
jgi:Domain of unknown function (DUF1707)